LRDRVIGAVIGGRMSRRGAAERFGVSLSSAIKWVQRFERSRSISSCTRRTVSTMPSGSSESRKECDVESCAAILQEPIVSSDAFFGRGLLEIGTLSTARLAAN
jgi:hypothetical protein